jgi:hypothetical protein
MAKKNSSSPAEQAQAGGQVTAPEITNADIVLNSDPIRYTAKGEELSIVSRNNPYKSGQRKIDNKTYALIQLSTSNKEVNNLLSNVTDEDFEGEPVFILCEQDHEKTIDAIENDLIDTVILKINLRLEDEEDPDSQILPSVQFKKAKNMESRVKREELEAKSRFFTSSKMNDVITASLLQSLQNA